MWHLHHSFSMTKRMIQSSSSFLSCSVLLVYWSDWCSLRHSLHDGVCKICLPTFFVICFTWPCVSIAWRQLARPDAPPCCTTTGFKSWFKFQPTTYFVPSEQGLSICRDHSVWIYEILNPHTHACNTIIISISVQALTLKLNLCPLPGWINKQTRALAALCTGVCEEAWRED